MDKTTGHNIRNMPISIRELYNDINNLIRSYRLPPQHGWIDVIDYGIQQRCLYGYYLLTRLRHGKRWMLSVSGSITNKDILVYTSRMSIAGLVDCDEEILYAGDLLNHEYEFTKKISIVYINDGTLQGFLINNKFHKINRAILQSDSFRIKYWIHHWGHVVGSGVIVTECSLD